MSDTKPTKSKRASSKPKEVEMVNAGEDTEVFTRQMSNSNESEQFAKPKGEQTRTAIKEVLANKLKIDNLKNIQDLQQAHQKAIEEESDKVLQVSYWEQKLNSEKLRLEQLRENQEKELQDVIAEAKAQQFPDSESTIQMMIQDLQ